MTDVNILDARPNPRDGYRVDVGWCERLRQVSSEWSSRLATKATDPRPRATPRQTLH